MISTTTLSRFILAEERRYSEATGELTDLVSSIALGIKYISSAVSSARFSEAGEYTGEINTHGEHTKILDEQADEILVEILGSSGHFGLLVSEERDTVVQTPHSSASSKYVVAFDPLDGSSNLGSNIPVGTIFTIFRKSEAGRSSQPGDFLKSGRQIVAAGYAVYGCRTSFVYSSGSGVHGFVLDNSIGEFVLAEKEIKSPERGRVYSINEGNSSKWHPAISSFIGGLKVDDAERGTPYSLRYVGSLVADFDRNLRNGGIFLYPGDRKNPHGKLRLLYECMPLAFIAEQAGGLSFNGASSILDVIPESIHERSPFFVGSPMEMRELIESFKLNK